MSSSKPNTRKSTRTTKTTEPSSTLNDFIKNNINKTKFDKLKELNRLDDGYKLNLNYFIEHHFKYPFIVKNKLGLDICIPEINQDELINELGVEQLINIIDVNNDKSIQVKVQDFFEEFKKAKNIRKKLWNLIDLELSSTKFNYTIQPPRIIRSISWGDNIYDEQDKPPVQKYNLYSMADSYTNFHCDFSGTSVWYHIYKGSKVFYLIEPTEENLKTFKKWFKSANKKKTYLPNLINDKCYKVNIKKGETLFLPGGWIHAVFTPEDSIVFGGNYLNPFRIPMQINIYEWEIKEKEKPEYRFPSFRDLNVKSSKLLLEFIYRLKGSEKLNGYIDDLKEYLRFVNSVIIDIDDESKNCISTIENLLKERDNRIEIASLGSLGSLGSFEDTHVQGSVVLPVQSSSEHVQDSVVLPVQGSSENVQGSSEHVQERSYGLYDPSLIVPDDITTGNYNFDFLHKESGDGNFKIFIKNYLELFDCDQFDISKYGLTLEQIKNWINGCLVAAGQTREKEDGQGIKFLSDYKKTLNKKLRIAFTEKRGQEIYLETRTTKYGESNGFEKFNLKFKDRYENCNPLLSDDYFN